MLQQPPPANFQNSSLEGNEALIYLLRLVAIPFCFTLLRQIYQLLKRGRRDQDAPWFDSLADELQRIQHVLLAVSKVQRNIGINRDEWASRLGRCHTRSVARGPSASAVRRQSTDSSADGTFRPTSSRRFSRPLLRLLLSSSSRSQLTLLSPERKRTFRIMDLLSRQARRTLRNALASHWLNRKNCGLTEMGLVTVFC